MVEIVDVLAMVLEALGHRRMSCATLEVRRSLSSQLRNLRWTKDMSTEVVDHSSLLMD